GPSFTPTSMGASHRRKVFRNAESAKTGVTGINQACSRRQPLDIYAQKLYTETLAFNHSVLCVGVIPAYDKFQTGLEGPRFGGRLEGCTGQDMFLPECLNGDVDRHCPSMLVVGYIRKAEHRSILPRIQRFIRTICDIALFVLIRTNHNLVVGRQEHATS